MGNFCLRAVKFLQPHHTDSLHTRYEAQGGAIFRADAIVIFRGVNLFVVHCTVTLYIPNCLLTANISIRLQKCKFVKKVLLMFYQPFHLLTPLLSISSLLSHSPSLPIALPRSLTPINISFFLLLSHTPQSIFLLYIFPFLSHSSISLYIHPSLTILPLYLSPFLSP